MLNKLLLNVINNNNVYEQKQKKKNETKGTLIRHQNFSIGLSHPKRFAHLQVLPNLYKFRSSASAFVLPLHTMN